MDWSRFSLIICVQRVNASVASLHLVMELITIFERTIFDKVAWIGKIVWSSFLAWKDLSLQQKGQAWSLEESFSSQGLSETIGLRGGAKGPRGGAKRSLEQRKFCEIELFLVST